MSKLDGRELHHYLEKENISNNDIRYMPEFIKNELFNLTKKCRGTIRERLFWLRNNLTDYPVCNHCGKSLTSKQFKTNVKPNAYREFCSKSCARSTDDFKAKTKQNMLQKYGVDHAFKSNEVQAKRKHTNLKKYGREHPHPWGSNEFNTNIITKYGSIEKYIQSHKHSVSKGLISHYIETGKIANIIQNIENRFYVECQNIEAAIDLERKNNHIKLEDLKLQWKHVFCGNIFEMAIIDGTLNVCPHCKKHGTSYLEQDILTSVLDLTNHLGINVIHKDRTVISPKEIDIYLPELKLGIEVNGIYWHSSDKADNDNHLIEKTLMAEKVGVKLIHIFENQWLNNKELILSKLKNIMNLNTGKVYARKCEIKEIDNDTKNDFLTKYHIQGEDKSLIKIGLFEKEKLVAVMTFGKPRFNRAYDWELIRYCTLSNFNVIGGFSKLFSYFKKKYCFDGYKIISYRDLSWGTNLDNVYSKNGFVLKNISKPNYMWASNNSFHYLSRYQTQKHKLNKLLPIGLFDAHLSESENMKKAGFLKIFNCGNAVYEFKVDLLSP